MEPKYGSWRTLVGPPFLHEIEMHTALLASHDAQWVFRAYSGGPLLGTQFEQTYWYPIRDGSPARKGQYARPEIPAVPEMAKKRIYLLRHGHREWLDEDGHPRVAVETRTGHELGGVEGVYAKRDTSDGITDRRIVAGALGEVRGGGGCMAAAVSQSSPS
ncbi:hypothetical protein ACWCXX_28155 [Streptomyces sp. NPDC001732]